MPIGVCTTLDNMSAEPTAPAAIWHSITLTGKIGGDLCEFLVANEGYSSANHRSAPFRCIEYWYFRRSRTMDWPKCGKVAAEELRSDIFGKREAIKMYRSAKISARAAPSALHEKRTIAICMTFLASCSVYCY